MLIGLAACSPCDCGNNQPVNLEDIPEEVSSKLYYKNDTVYVFKHSSGTIIEYQSEVQFTDSDEVEERCDCPTPEINNEQHYTTKLTTEVFAPNITLELNNLRQPYYPLTIGVWETYFELPLSSEDAGFEIPSLDEFVVDGQTYYNVFALGKSKANQRLDEIDSLYYNHEFGIIKIGNANGEFYVRQD